MFTLYIGQKLMRPKSFFDIMAGGIANALMPILLLVLAEAISDCLVSLGLLGTLETAIPALVGGRLCFIPAAVFVFCTLLDIALGSSWGMYGLGIPLIVFLASKLSLNIPLCLGAVLSAGILGDGLCPYLDFTAPAVTAIGCEPRAFRRLRIGAWLPVGIVCVIIYVALGLIFI
ncbi:MAG: hypothetical protein MJ067_03200 [Oscillospiraceae bacterium]|nr:hypothetical protein [Oscillospiraceae bacterium]